MFSRCNKTSEGFRQNLDSSESTASSYKVKSEYQSTPATKEGEKKPEYRSRLRPRPTRQTEYYKTPIFVKRYSRLPAPSKRPSEVSLTPSVETKLVKKNPTLSSPLTSGVKNRSRVKNLPKTKNSPNLIEKPGPSTSNLGRRRSTTDISKLFPSSSNQKKKLASNFDPDSKKKFEDPVPKGEPPALSNDNPSSSKKSTNSKSGTKPKPKLGSQKFSNRFPLGWKSKSEEPKGQRLKQSSIKQKQKSGKGEGTLLESTSKKFTAKTGSCASSRRGSERGKRTSSVAGNHDQPSPSDDGCNTASNSTMQHPSRSRHNRDSVNQLRDPAQNNEATNDIAARGPTPDALPATSGASSNNDSESDDSDVNRLQALLEARGLPPHFFGNLGPRMQQILHRSMGSGVISKAQQYLQGMQAVGDESKQLQAAIGMCQLLVMGNEDTLAGFPIKSTVPALINLLKMEHNFDLMNHACRALTYMMEALPRSSAVVVDAVPAFLEKLQAIQCMDVAEQCLTALDMLSRRHAPAILAAGGQSACLLYIDFFSLPAQRSALSVAANCCLAIGTLSLDATSPEEEFNRLVKSSLPLLSSRLTHHDKKCVESVCLCFVRLVDNYQQDPKILAQIARNDLFKNFQQLLVVTPPLLSSSTFVMVIRTMSTLSSGVPSLASKLVKDNIAETLKYLLCGTPSEADSGPTELVSRSPQELFEITSLIGEMLPKLPKKYPLFNINSLLWQGEGSDPSDKNSPLDRASWQWKDESGQWRPYIRHDSRIIEAAHSTGEEEVNLTTMDRSYTIDFETMQQINDDTGTTRAVQRVARQYSNNHRKSSKKQALAPIEDHVPEVIEVAELIDFIKILFKILYEVYSSSAGSPAVRHRCLRAIQRMVYYTQPSLLSDILRDLTVSSHISSMLSSPDIKVVVGALQLSEMLMQKLPDIFSEMFNREGVLHQVKKLTEPSHPLVGSEKLHDSSSSSSASTSRKSTPGCDDESALAKSVVSPKAQGASSFTPAFLSRRVSPPLTKAKAFAAALSTEDNDNPSTTKKKVSSRSARTTRSSTSSFLSSLNPTKWGRSLSSALSSDNGASNNNEPRGASSEDLPRSDNKSALRKMKQSSLGLPIINKLSPSSKESSDLNQVKEWIRTQASKFLEKYFNENAENNNKQTNILDQLTEIANKLGDSSSEAVDALRELSRIVMTVDVSSFELQHSGLVTSLLHYLTAPDAKDPDQMRSDMNKTRPPVLKKVVENVVSNDEKNHVEMAGDCKQDLHARIRCFLHVFAELPLVHTMPVKEAISQLSAEQTAPMQSLVRKLNQCVGQLEQLPVKSHDFLSGGSQVLHVLSTRQLKCQLQKHPDSHNVKQWLGGPVKVDPLVQVQAIERYLITRGYGVKSSDGASSETSKKRPEISLLTEDEDSEDEIQEDDDGFTLDDNTSDCVSSEAESQLSGAGTTATSSTASFGDLTERRERKSSTSSHHKLEFYIGNHKLPHHITVYQAIRQYGRSPDSVSSDDISDTSFMASESAAVWNKTHVIRYMLINHDDESGATGRASSTKSKSSKRLKNTGKQARASLKTSKTVDPAWTDGISSPLINPLDRYLVPHLGPRFSTVDACSEVLCLLRVVHAISRYWYYMYSSHAIYTDRPLVSHSEFINVKINAKCTRQLQDPLIIITGQLTSWLEEVAAACPFLLSFETRQLLFKITAFDRDRAMQHLLDIGAAQELSNALSSASDSGDSHSHSSSSRFLPRIEKKKCSVSRKNLLQQAERIISDYGHSKAMIEVDFESEVGTGLGPTLEFFTLTSKELQRSVLNIWREELMLGQPPTIPDEEKQAKENEDDKLEDCKVVSIQEDAPIEDEITSSSTEPKKAEGSKEIVSEAEREYVNSPMGLFPKPIGKGAKLSQVNRIRSKYRFLGKFLAKALVDGRMVDLPLSVASFKWLLGEEHSFCSLDLEYVDPALALTFNRLRKVAHEREVILVEDADKIESVMMDGCPIEDLGLDMQLPGYPNVELMKGGKNIPVTIHNLDKYLGLLIHWTLCEGSRQQFEAMRDGFNSILPLSSLNYFYPEELDQLFCGSRYQPWDVHELAEMCHPDHGYTQDSITVKNLYRILSTYDYAQQRSFLQFVTGCPNLPVGGFRALNPRLTIVRKTCDDAENIDDYLPSVMTCLNYLKLPDYSNEAIMREKLKMASAEGQKSFLLS